jgi:hypothetical protein
LVSVVKQARPGGQNPAIVDGTGNIADAARKIVWGAMAWGGQWCTSPGYAYVHESVADQFVAEAKRALVKMFGTNPKNNPDYSRIIGTREAQRLHALIDQSKAVAGGDADPEARYVAPTILYPISWEHEIMEDEIFGLILPILTYTDFDDALGRIAGKPAPLAAFIFSTRQDHIDGFIGSLSYGGGAVNQVNIHLFIESMPFGGVGPAGMGHYYGRYGFEALTHAKSILIAPDCVAIDHLIPPYDRSKVEALSIPKSDVRRLQPAISPHNADFAGLSDFREIALAEIEICPDDSGWVAVGRIDQIDRPLRQRVLRQQRHQALLANGRGRQEGRQFRHYVATERTVAQVMIIVGGQDRFGLDHMPTQFPAARNIAGRRPRRTRKAMKRVGLGRHAAALHQLWTGDENVAERQYVSRHHGLVNDRPDAKGDVDAILDQVHATLG